MQERTVCAICKNSDFEFINKYPNYPIKSNCTNEEPDEFFDFSLIFCKVCTCLQLQNLVDPSVLYSKSYMTGSSSQSWTNHYEFFANFILENTSTKSFLEIGANSGKLYKILSDRHALDYTVLDMYRDSNLPSEVKFLEGNCELFNFTGINTVVLSHVFEHLYSPSNFVKRLSESGVPEIFISNPNFDICLKNKFFNTINVQHTYYCGYDHMVYLFSLNKYRLESFVAYDGVVKSQMYKFVYDPAVKPLAIPCIDKDLYTDIYVKNANSARNLEITEPTVICPAGVYGQALYYFIKNKEMIIGFIDNDKQRHNKKFYGTGKLVYSPQDIDYDKTDVLLCDSMYNDEIIQGLKQICSSVKIRIV